MTDTTTVLSASSASPASGPAPAMPGPACDQAARFADLGSRGAWARDFAILGALSTGLGLANMGFAGFLPSIVIVGAILGALTGFGLGWTLEPILARDGARMPGGLVAVFGPILGGFWGAAVGALTVLAVFPEGLAVGTVVGAIAGLLQVGWFWVVYLALRLRKAPTWPALALAALTPFIGGALLRMGSHPFDLRW